MSLVNVFPELRVLAKLQNYENEMGRQVFQPPVDLKETKESFELKINVPGFSKDQIEIDAAGNNLHVRGHYESEKEEHAHHHYRERVESSFQRSVRLPITIPADRIQASLKDGVLQIVVPKGSEPSKRITIQ